MSPELKDFNPNGVGVVGGGFFSLPCSVELSKVVLISAPWDVTVSYGAGTAAAPEALCEASSQLDLYDSSAHDAWREGIATLPIDSRIGELSKELRPVAERIIEHLEAGGLATDPQIVELVESVNEGSRELNAIIYRSTADLLAQGKIVGLVGGDHSTPYGAIKAIAEHHQQFGILHIDAHCDLRETYEGFDSSHASIMFNVMRDFSQVTRLVQVGVRDYCDDELRRAEESDRITMFDDYTLSRARFEGKSWQEQTKEIVEQLPQDVYISFDIDGLSMSYCPNTGTPVSGGLSFNEALYLLETITASGRRIIGFDLVEVSPSQHQRVDAVVGARMLYKLCGQTIVSNR